MKKIVSVILSFVILVMLTGCDSADYKKAVSLYESGNYTAAAEIFGQLGDYENSGEMTVKCNYYIAKQHFENLEYAEAIKLFESLGNYEDCADLLMQCRTAYATTLFDSYNYVAAREQFKLLEQTEEVMQSLRLCAWGMLQTYVEENGPIIDEVESFDPAGSEEIFATYSVSNRHGTLTIQAKNTENSKQTDGFYYIRVGRSIDSTIRFNADSNSVTLDSEYNYEMENNVSFGPSDKNHYTGSGTWNIYDFYADGDVNDFVEVTDGKIHLGSLYRQLIGVVEFLQVQLPKTDLDITIRDLGFTSF